jgi:hypothetical protein
MRGFGYAIISAALLTGCMSAADHRADGQTDPGAAAQHVQPGPDADSGGRGGTEEGHDIHSGPM